MSERRYLFVGEKPSVKAHECGVVWADGGLAAKQLFDALKRLAIDPSRSMFFNLFGNTPAACEVIVPPARLLLLGELAEINRLDVVAMGLKVSRHLQKFNIPHRTIVHPAARGAIRQKDRYARHIKDVLLQPQLFSGTVAPKLVGPARGRRLAVTAEAA